MKSQLSVNEKQLFFKRASSLSLNDYSVMARASNFVLAALGARISLVHSRIFDMLIDISPKISPRLAVFPGDTPFSREVLMSFEQKHHLTLSSITTTVHLGAHTDAPNHYTPNGQDMAERELDYYLGHCQVITVDKDDGVIKKGDFATQITQERVLFRTLSFPDPNEWSDDFCSVSSELIEELAKCGVKLIGIDTPSIDHATSKDLAAHQAIARNDMAILEGIVLDHVVDGIYELIALPLKIAGADASPVRAVLRTL